MSELNETFARNLAVVRTMRKLSQKALAEKSHISPSSICRYELGKGLPGLAEIKRLKLALNVTYEILLDASVMKQCDKWIDELIAESERLRLYDRKGIKDIWSKAGERCRACGLAHPKGSPCTGELKSRWLKPVEVCHECDIENCKHIRARNLTNNSKGE